MPPSLLWRHFVRCEGGGKAKCSYCLSDLATGGGNTSGLKKHLKTRHPEKYKEFAAEEAEREKENDSKKRKKSSTAEDEEAASKQQKLDVFLGRDKYDKDSVTQVKFDEAMVEFFADSFVPFYVAGRDSFRNVINIANKRITVKHPTTYSRQTEEAAKKTLAKVCDIIGTFKDEMESVAFTTDLWTSRAGDCYISLTAHFIDPLWRLHRWTPFVKPFHGRHTGVLISVELDNMIAGLKMKDNVAKYCVNDNAANVVLAVGLSHQLNEYTCDLHTLQLAILDTFKHVPGMKSALTKCKEVAKFTHQSTSVALNELKDEAKNQDLNFLKLQNPGDTRWNGAHDNMSSVLHLKSAIQTLCENNVNWEDKSLDRNEWKLVEGAVNILKPFREATKILEHEKIPTINRVIERVYFLQSHLSAFIENPQNCRFGVGFARELKKNLDKRFPDFGMGRFERRVANYLDPRYKGVHLKTKHKFSETKKEIENDWKENQNHEIVEDGAEADESIDEIQLSPTSKLMQQYKSQNQNERDGNVSEIRREMEKYESYSILQKDKDILLWWKVHEGNLPNLARLAKRIFAIPSSSAKSERVFSTGGNHCTAKRSSLDPEKLECLIVIKENKKKIELFEKHSAEYTIKKSDSSAFEEISFTIINTQESRSLLPSAIFIDDVLMN